MIEESHSLLADVRNYFLNRPEIPTLVEHSTPVERQEYSRRILQRIGVRVDDYGILNIHRIGIEAPASFVFEELLTWDRNSLWWPNHLATLERVDGNLDHIDVFLLGRKQSLFGIKTGFLGFDFIPLFQFMKVRQQGVPETGDVDNARYLLYDCGGGYPIGIATLYVRSSIAGSDEVEQTQLFFGVSFNFYGNRDWSKPGLVSRTWEAIHNRVTANVLNRFKQLCEWRFGEIRRGSSGAVGET